MPYRVSTACPRGSNAYGFSSSLYNKEDVQLLDGLMQDLNEILLDILRKLKDAFEPPIIPREIIDLDTGKLIPNPKCNPDK